MKAHLRATSVSSLLPRKTFCISQPPAFQALMIKLTRSRQMMRTDLFSQLFDGSATAEVVDLEAIYSNLSEPAAESGAALREFDFLLRAPDSDRVGPNDAPAILTRRRIGDATPFGTVRRRGPQRSADHRPGRRFVMSARSDPDQQGTSA